MKVIIREETHFGCGNTVSVYTYDETRSNMDQLESLINEETKWMGEIDEKEINEDDAHIFSDDYSVWYFIREVEEKKIEPIRPTSIRAYATIKFQEPIPEEAGRVWTWEGFTIGVDGELLSIDFDDKEISVDPKDRSIVEVMWKNPDWDAFPEEFEQLTLKVLKNSKITLEDDLESTILASRTPDIDSDDDSIWIEKIQDMRLTSPYDEFEDIVLVENGIYK